MIERAVYLIVAVIVIVFLARAFHLI
jgi:hypothetical protein